MEDCGAGSWFEMLLMAWMGDIHLNSNGSDMAIRSVPLQYPT
jgi:hypothetical protein